MAATGTSSEPEGSADPALDASLVEVEAATGGSWWIIVAAIAAVVFCCCLAFLAALLYRRFKNKPGGPKRNSKITIQRPAAPPVAAPAPAATRPQRGSRVSIDANDVYVAGRLDVMSPSK